MDLIKHPIKSNDNIDRFVALHYVDIVDAKMLDDGIVTMKLVDYYDFNKLDDNIPLLPDNFEQIKKQGVTLTAKNMAKAVFNNKINRLNNRAYNQQKNGKLKPYIIYKEFKFKL